MLERHCQRENGHMQSKLQSLSSDGSLASMAVVEGAILEGTESRALAF